MSHALGRVDGDAGSASPAKRATLPYRSSVTSVSWLPPPAIPMSLMKVPVLLRIAHSDVPLPDRLDDLDSLHAASAFRFANRRSVWVEVEEGEIVDAGYEGGGLMSATVADFKVTKFVFPPVPHPDLQREPEYPPSFRPGRHSPGMDHPRRSPSTLTAKAEVVGDLAVFDVEPIPDRVVEPLVTEGVSRCVGTIVAGDVVFS